ncbi:MAG: hypothetical protein JSV88_07135 [Candidatus Aminicenantes bacterium]|nr:MAG: hypothetical protein JSV88_07135 [Candidatus Aminicenantes bacterium]
MAQEKKSAESTFHLFAVTLLEKLVEVFRGILTSNFLAFCIKWATKIGHLAIIAAAVLGFLFALIFAIRKNEFIAFLYGIAWVLLIFVIQYTAHRFLDAGEGLVKNNPTQLSSKAFLDCVAFLSMIGGVVVLIIHLIQLIQGEPFRDFLVGLGLFVFLELLALLAFNPDEVTIKITRGNTAGQEALGIVTFFIKSYMKLIPIFFGVLLVVWTILLLIALIGLFGDSPNQAWLKGFGCATQILSVALLPFIAYILFALFYLIIDVIKSILSIPEKLDKLGKK